MATDDDSGGRAGVGSPHPGFLPPHPQGWAGPHPHMAVENPSPAVEALLDAALNGRLVFMCPPRHGRTALMRGMKKAADERGLEVWTVGPEGWRK